MHQDPALSETQDGATGSQLQNTHDTHADFGQHSDIRNDFLFPLAMPDDVSFTLPSFDFEPSTAQETIYTSSIPSPASAEGKNMVSPFTSEFSSQDDTSTLARPLKQEKNRIAAHKCRQKSKAKEAGLQLRERELQRTNKFLNVQVRSLRDEVISLKHEILRHSSCDSDVIQGYIAMKARKLCMADDGTVFGA